MLFPYLPPVWLVLVDDLQDLPLLEGESQGLAGNLLILTASVVEVGTHVFLWEGGGGEGGEKGEGEGGEGVSGLGEVGSEETWKRK